MATYARARDQVIYELKRINGANIVVTSNIPLNSRGVPDMRGEPSVTDPGIAVWWQEKGGVERVIGVDRWPSLGQNLRAIAKALEAMRGIERWGASQISERAFASFTALPAGDGKEAPSEPDWWDVLEIDTKLFELEPADLNAIVGSRYKKLAAQAHPDRGGSLDAMTRLNGAYEKAKTFVEQMGSK